MATGVLLLPDNRVEIAENGDGTFSRLWEDLRSAQRSIVIQMYYGLPGRVVDALSETLSPVQSTAFACWDCTMPSEGAESIARARDRD